MGSFIFLVDYSCFHLVEKIYLSGQAWSAANDIQIGKTGRSIGLNAGGISFCRAVVFADFRNSHRLTHAGTL